MIIHIVTYSINQRDKMAKISSEQVNFYLLSQMADDGLVIAPPFDGIQ